MSAKSLIMPGVIFFSLLLILPPAGVSHHAVWGVAFGLAAWSWLSGRVTAGVANFCLRNQLGFLGLVLTLAAAVLSAFVGPLYILHILADSFHSEIASDSLAPLVALFIFVASNAVRIIVNATTKS